MATITEIKVLMPRRRAKARLYVKVACRLGLIGECTADTPDFDEYDCFVLLASQEMDDDGCYPVFVCEFYNGTVYNVGTESVTFVDTNENGEIIEEGDVDDSV